MLLHAIVPLVVMVCVDQPLPPATSPAAQPGAQTTPARATDPAAPDTANAPRVEVVFVLDTTGSMGALIDGAQKKIWSIANAIASCKPAPRLKVGLVAYRDRGDDYVTRVVQLTDDLDAVYMKLMAFRADGGGDGPESVNQALNDAVTKIEWTPVGAPGQAETLRFIYLVGDAPPHMDYSDDVKHPETCAMAMKKGLTINTIQCGGETDTTPVWTAIARASEGAYFKIAQTGGVVAVGTPFDDTLVTLNAELEKTALAYGDASLQRDMEGKRRMQADISSAAASPAAPAATKAAAADRAVYNRSTAGVANMWGWKDLVVDTDAGLALATVSEDDLPTEMKAMTPAQRAEFVAARSKARKELQKKIDATSVQRDAFLKAELAKLGAKSDSFDGSVIKAFREQAGRKGVRFEDRRSDAPAVPQPSQPEVAPPPRG